MNTKLKPIAYGEEVTNRLIKIVIALRFIFGSLLLGILIWSLLV